MDRLNPCSICGGDANLVSVPCIRGVVPYYWWVVCSNGCISTHACASEHDAVEAWNNIINIEKRERSKKKKKTNNYTNEKTCCSAEEQKRETAKNLLDDMEKFLREIENHVAAISDAVYRCERPVEKGPDLTSEPCATPPMVVMMREQRDTAERLLKEIIKIREALW